MYQVMTNKTCHSCGALQQPGQVCPNCQMPEIDSISEDTTVKGWYMAEYPDDPMGIEIDPAATFYDMFFSLDRYHDIYELLGVSDSIIRERCFAQLADIMGVDYSYVYDQWLNRRVRA